VTASKTESFESLRARIADGAVELPDDPAVRADLLAIRKVVTRNGIGIELPRTTDGRHCDYAPALALAVSKTADGALPAWVGAMKAWRAGTAAWAPDDETFGQRERKMSAIKFYTLVNGDREAVGQCVPRDGNLEPFTEAMVARWMPNGPTRFTPACSDGFKAEIEKHRRTNP
jgi:hypothetical protein